MSFGERCFRALLRLYPRRFRERFGEELLECYHEDARAGDVRWVSLALDAVRTAVAEHARAMQRDAAERRRSIHSSDQVSISSTERGDSMLTKLAQDVRYAIRGMLKQPAFSAIVLATLALGIGANTAIFSVVNGILLRPLPYPQADRIVRFVHEQPFGSVSEGEFLDYHRDLRSMEKLAAFTRQEVSLMSGEEPTRVGLSRVSADFFDILGTRPMLGRLFTADEYKPGGPRITLLSYGLWKTQFGGDSSLVGKEITLAGIHATVIGVLPPQFDYPSTAIGLFTPMRLDPANLWGRNNHYFTMLGRLAPTSSVAGASKEADALGLQWKQQYPDIYGNSALRSHITLLGESITGETRPFLLALLGAVGFVLLIACVNVANLFLARGETRRKEVAIRSALGATQQRLSAQFITESLLFALGGGALGLLIAWGAQGALLAAAPASIPRVEEIRLDTSVLLFTATLILLTGLLFGLYPAMRASRSQPASNLREGGRSSSSGAGWQVRRAMVVSEVALAVIMLTGAGIMLRSLWKLQATDIGLDPHNVLTAQVSLPQSVYTEERPVQFFDQAIARISAIPGVVSAAAVRSLAMVDGGDRWSIMVDGVVLRTIGEAPSMAPQQVTPNYFRTMNIPIVAGRAFTEQDRAGAPIVAIVNEEMARELWKGANPIGHTIKMFNDAAAWATIVGVVKDTKNEGLTEQVPPMMYFPHAQANRSNYSASLTMKLVVRTAGPPESVARAVRESVHALDPAVPVTQVRSMDDVIAESIAGRRFSTALLVLFAGLALLLAGIGIYGVIAFSVSQRTFEIGVRVALGAQRTSVIALVLRQSLTMTVLGIAIGLLGAAAVTQASRSMLIGVSSYDPATFVAASVVIAIVAIVAGIVPARRALGVDPITALRGE